MTRSMVPGAFVILTFVSDKFQELNDTEIISKDAIPDMEDSMKILQKKDESRVFEKGFQRLCLLRLCVKWFRKGEHHTR
ncbi:MAG: hypothetical protein ABIM30_08470 [candidate division WOR-3 bacterium]